MLVKPLREICVVQPKTDAANDKSAAEKRQQILAQSKSVVTAIKYTS